MDYLHRYSTLLRSISFAFCMLLATGLALSQDQKISVYVSHSGADSVGQQFAYAIREQLRGSKAFQLGAANDLGLQVRIVTLNPDESSSSVWTVASVVYTMSNFLPYEKGNPQTWYAIHLGSQVLIVGQRRTDDQARAAIAFLDSALEKYRNDARR